MTTQESILLMNSPLFTIVHLEEETGSDLSLPSDACIAYILKGNGEIFSSSDHIVAKKGHTILSLCGLTLGKVLSDQPKGNIQSVLVHFKREVLNMVFEGEKPQLWEELQTPVTQFIVQTAANELVCIYFESIIKLFENKTAITENILKLKLKEIVLLLLQSDNSEYVREIIKSLFSERQFTFKELVEAHIENTGSIENLALLTNCSVSTFKRQFAKCFQTTPARYRHNLKLAKVAELLKTTDGAISHIGYECGFSSPEHLTRSFKEKFGSSPTEYRLNFSVK